MTEFTREDFVSALQSYVLMSDEDISVALRSLNDDFACIVNTYLPRYKSTPGRIFKYFVDGTNQINPAIANVPNNCGGVYIFLIKPNVISDIHLYLAYIGRARKTPYQNLRKRVSEYASETERLKIVEMKRYWSPYLYVQYLPLPLESNDCIDELEKELIKTVLPPFNDRYPEVYNQAIRAAF